MINLAKQLNDQIKQLNESKEYFALKKAIQEDKYLNQLLETINKTQNEAKNHLKNNDIAAYKISVAELEVLKKEFIENPLINNYIQAKEELYAILNQVVDILSEW